MLALTDEALARLAIGATRGAAHARKDLTRDQFREDQILR